MDSFSLKILKIYNGRHKLSLIELGAIMNQSPIDLGQYVLRLIRKSYLCVTPDYEVFQSVSDQESIAPDTPIQITIDGKEAIEEADKLSAQRKSDQIRYAITTSIAVVALIVAIVSVVLQYR